MYGYFGTTVLQAGLLFSGILTFGQITDRWLETSLVFVSGALVISVIRRNQLYDWLQKKSDEKMSRLPGLWLDMSERITHRENEVKKAELRAREQLMSLQQSLSSLDAGLVSLTDQWHIQWWNEPASRLLGLRTEYDEEAALFNLVRTPELIRYVEEQNFELPITLPSPITSGRMLEYTVCPVRDSGILLVVRDVTRFTRLERMRSDFIANISHELKTPLTVINGYLETIVDNQMVAPQGQRAITQALRQAERMNQLLQDLLLLSQLETTPLGSKPSVISVKEILEHALREGNELKHALDKQNTQIRLDDISAMTLSGDWKELASAIGNLTANAVRYCPDGSDIRLGFCVEGDHGVLTVTDDGPGIPPEHLPRLTERFYRVDNSHSPATGGTGLGLAIVKHVMLRHGGVLDIQSKPNQGSTFRCLFPKDRLGTIKAVAAP